VGTETTYSADPRERVREYPQSAGKDTLLVTAIQARNNARVVFSGSLDLFSNKLFNAAVQQSGDGSKKHDRSGNEDFCRELSLWAFQQRGLLRASSLTHNLVGSTNRNPQAYRVKDNIQFSVLLEQYDGASGKWVPFTNNDVQLEFVMIDPYVRLNLRHDGKGRYSLDFQVPDVYGVFKFRLQYHKVGWSNLDLEQQVSVHPFRHNEFERFIDVAYPYYLSTICNLVAFFIFGFVFLYNRSDAPRGIPSSQ
jgi:oligosaccharyltransferase complex subunit beta